MFSRAGWRISSTHPGEADSRIDRNYRREPLASTQLYGLTVSPGRHTHERFSSSGSVNVAGSEERRNRVHTTGSHGSARAHAGTRLPAGRARALPYRRYASSV